MHIKKTIEKNISLKHFRSSANIVIRTHLLANIRIANNKILAQLENCCLILMNEKSIEPSEGDFVVSLDALFGDAVALECALLANSTLAVSCSPNIKPDEGAAFCREHSLQQFPFANQKCRPRVIPRSAT